MRIRFGLVASVAFSLFAGQLPAQDVWPARTVRLVVPSSPGGGTDVFARLLAQALGDALKQQFVVENRPGASGNIGAEVAAKSAPDGYTFLVSANPALTAIRACTEICRIAQSAILRPSRAGSWRPW